MTLNEYFSSYYALICDGHLDSLEQYYSVESPLFSARKRQFEKLRQQFDFKFLLQNISVIAKQDDLLVVIDRLNFQAEIGGKSVEKTSVNLHSLVKELGEWKIHSSTQLPEFLVK
ncbi:hypothetical protein WNY63_21375 [Pseudoalteromonas neustonica]|uniref:Nuclear transport factor 2 family protein n=1 Tax=Pseudoalteromonas neustonica TaxID=1840331 RepID=A0ABU9U884_9GAMM